MDTEVYFFGTNAVGLGKLVQNFEFLKVETPNRTNKPAKCLNEFHLEISLQETFKLVDLLSQLDLVK